ncbi:universal stress protein [Lentzea sp. NPDC058450]|uniref:universal stress protein n=1 Tax=Lentzea sp. NPDC058450 TaxID=3346505 RepID=UPI00365BDD6C
MRTRTAVEPRRFSFWAPDFSRSVTVGVDTSEFAYHAFEWAARHAWSLRTDLQVYLADPGDTTVQKVLERLPMLTAHFRPSGDDPVAALVGASDSSATLVLGCKGEQHRGLGLGSLVLPVLRRARCGVVVVRGRPEAIRGEHGWVTAAVGGCEDPVVLRRAVELCRTRRARLRLLHIHLPAQHDPSAPRDEAALRRAVLFLRTTAPELTPEVRVEARHPHESMASLDSDLVVVGRGGQHDGVGLVTRAALHHASCPVLVARAEPAKD